MLIRWQHFIPFLPHQDRNRVSDGGDPSDCRASGLETTFEKVVDTTYEGVGARGGSEVDREEISTPRDIGIVSQCLEECSRRGRECLSVTLLNERGGRQRCFSLDGSAAADGGQTQEETGVTYYEKICASESM